jgi:hypothetical protein
MGAIASTFSWLNGWGLEVDGLPDRKRLAAAKFNTKLTPATAAILTAIIFLFIAYYRKHTSPSFQHGICNSGKISKSKRKQNISKLCNACGQPC